MDKCVHVHRRRRCSRDPGCSSPPPCACFPRRFPERSVRRCSFPKKTKEAFTLFLSVGGVASGVMLDWLCDTNPHYTLMQDCWKVGYDKEFVCSSCRIFGCKLFGPKRTCRYFQHTELHVSHVHVHVVVLLSGHFAYVRTFLRSQARVQLHTAGFV